MHSACQIGGRSADGHRGPSLAAPSAEWAVFSFQSSAREVRSILHWSVPCLSTLDSSSLRPAPSAESSVCSVQCSARSPQASSRPQGKPRTTRSNTKGKQNAEPGPANRGTGGKPAAASASELASASADFPPCIEFLDALRLSDRRPVRRRRTRTALVGGGASSLARAAGHRGPSRRSRDKGRLRFSYSCPSWLTLPRLSPRPFPPCPPCLRERTPLSHRAAYFTGPSLVYRPSTLRPFDPRPARTLKFGSLVSSFISAPCSRLPLFTSSCFPLKTEHSTKTEHLRHFSLQAAPLDAHVLSI